MLVDRAAGERHRGRAASLSGTAIFAGQFLSPLLFGPLVSATSTVTGLLVAAGISAVILAVVGLRRVGAQPDGGALSAASAMPTASRAPVWIASQPSSSQLTSPSGSPDANASAQDRYAVSLRR